MDIVLAFILIFITAFLIVKIIQILIEKAFDGEIMKSLDRVLGFAFGALEGILIVSCIMILVCAQIWFSSAFIAEKSTMYHVLSPILEYPISYIRGCLA